MPSSATARRATPSRHATDNVTGLPAPYLMAFERRFVTTLSSRTRSQDPIASSIG